MSAHWNGVKTPQVLLISIVSTLPVRRNRRFHRNPAKAVTGGTGGKEVNHPKRREKKQKLLLCHSRAGGNPLLLTLNFSSGYYFKLFIIMRIILKGMLPDFNNQKLWIPACAGMTYG